MNSNNLILTLGTVIVVAGAYSQPFGDKCEEACINEHIVHVIEETRGDYPPIANTNSVTIEDRFDRRIAPYLEEQKNANN